MKRITVLIFILLSLVLVGCRETPPDEEGSEKTETRNGGVMIPETVQLTEFYFSHTGMTIDQIYSYALIREGEEVDMKLEWRAGKYVLEEATDLSYIQAIEEIMRREEIGAWNGFDQRNDQALDGSGFSLYAVFDDGTEISASGQNSFPAGYREVERAINEVFRERMDE